VNDEHGDRPRQGTGKPPDDWPDTLSQQDRALWSAFERLNDRERRYLRLTAQGYTSKDIALREGGRDQSISKVIERARIKCGGVLRRDLSRKYAEWETWKAQATGEVREMPAGPRPAAKSLDGQSFPMVGPEPGLPQAAPVHRDGAWRRPRPEPAEPSSRASPYISMHLPIGMGGSARNELDGLPRLVAILIIAAAGALTAGAALSLLFVLDHLASSP